MQLERGGRPALGSRGELKCGLCHLDPCTTFCLEPALKPSISSYRSQQLPVLLKALFERFNVVFFLLYSILLSPDSPELTNSVILFFLVGGTEVTAQGFMLARQAFCC
jgi:hypothetical protein